MPHRDPRRRCRVNVLAGNPHDGIPPVDHHDRTNDHAITNVCATLTTTTSVWIANDETVNTCVCAVYLRMNKTSTSEHETKELRISKSSDSHLHLRLLIGESDPIGIVGRQQTHGLAFVQCQCQMR